MNYLAHAFLSFNNPKILVGNLMNDFVKGAQKFDYELEIQNGMKLHRVIDAFTDAHELNKNIKKLFVPAYRLYAGAFIDVCYDHFLAKHFNSFSILPLEDFAQATYITLNDYALILHPNFAKIAPNMQRQNWLCNYQYTWAIERSFAGLKYRAKYIAETETAFELFKQNYEEIEAAFLQFFPALWLHAKSHFEEF
jgi:acyl carrier protein phosphodiesterase